MNAPYSGGCLCGAVRYRILSEPETLYACHCTDCQRRGGTAFALSLVVRREAVESTGETTLFVRSAQPWFRLPEGVAVFETQPAEPWKVLFNLWRKR